MREFATAFYKSKAWQRCRAGYIAYRRGVDGGLCEICGDQPGYIVHHKTHLTPQNINDANITSDILAQERADYELRQKLILKTTASVTTMFNPLLMVNNMVGITDEFYGFEQEKFLIQSLSYSLDASGTMSLSLTNARNLPFVVGGR